METPKVMMSTPLCEGQCADAQFATERFHEAYKTCPASDAIPTSHCTQPLPNDEGQLTNDQGPMTIEVRPSRDGFTPHRIRQLESVYGFGRVALMLDVIWEIAGGLQTVTKTYYPPFTKVDREEGYHLTWEEVDRTNDNLASGVQSPVSCQQGGS